MGDAIRGERIAVEASEISKIMISKRSAAHKGQPDKLIQNTYCVIEMPLKWVSEKKDS